MTVDLSGLVALTTLSLLGSPGESFTLQEMIWFQNRETEPDLIKNTKKKMKLIGLVVPEISQF